MSKNHQVIGSKVAKNLKLELIFCLIDIIDIKFSWPKMGVNLTISYLKGLITQSEIEISDT